MLTYRHQHRALIDIEELADEDVGMLCLDGEARQGGAWKILQIVGDDDRRTSMTSCSKDMAVVRVWQVEPIDQVLMTGHEAIGGMLVHQVSLSLDLRAGEVGALGEQGTHPLLVDLRRPFRPEEALQGEPHQEVAERCRVEHIGVEQRDDRVHALLQAQFLVVGRELV